MTKNHPKDFAGSQKENKTTNKGNSDIDNVYSPRVHIKIIVPLHTFSVGFRWTVGRLKGRRCVALLAHKTWI